MFAYDPETAAFLATNPDARVDLAVWITARNRDTGADETLGVWTGERAVTLSIGGGPRTYIGAGALLAAGDVVYTPGPEIYRWTITFSGASPEVRQAWLTYDVRGAPIEAHQVIRRARTMQLVGTPRMFFEGEIEAVDPSRPPAGQEHVARIVCATAQRRMRQPLTATKSDEHQSKRTIPGVGPDRIRRHAGVTGLTPVRWG